MQNLRCTGANVPESIAFLPGTDAYMELPRSWVSDPGLSIYSLNLMGQARTNHEMALLLFKQMTEKNVPCDMIVTIEAKAIAVAQELAMLLGHPYYVVLRKSMKAYMQNAHCVTVRSITTESKQLLFLDGRDAELLRTLQYPVFLDDVISTGASFGAANDLMRAGGCKPLEQCVCVATEGKALEANPHGYIRLGHL
ncbi:MAG: hypothetical protein FWG37_06255, partial [Clostridia bacterium]|nr:hypothetical protein [Clostridia bacterium]